MTTFYHSSELSDPDPSVVHDETLRLSARGLVEDRSLLLSSSSEIWLGRLSNVSPKEPAEVTLT